MNLKILSTPCSFYWTFVRQPCRYFFKFVAFTIIVLHESGALLINQLFTLEYPLFYSYSSHFAQHKKMNEVKLFCWKYCPYAHRAWLAANYMQIEYTYCELNPYENRENQEWRKISPAGKVPVMQGGQGRGHYSTFIYERALLFRQILRKIRDK